MPTGLSWGLRGGWRDGQGKLRMPGAGQRCSHQTGDAQSAANSSPRCCLPLCPLPIGGLCAGCRAGGLQGADGRSLPSTLIGRVVAVAVPGLAMGPGVQLVPPRTAIMLLNPPERHRRMRPEPPSEPWEESRGRDEAQPPAALCAPATCPKLAWILRPHQLQCPRILCSAQPQPDGMGEAEPWPAEDTESVLGLATSPRACPMRARGRGLGCGAAGRTWGS